MALNQSSSNADATGVELAPSDNVMLCTPYLCKEWALPAPMTPMLRTILQCIAFALVVIADCLHLLFLVRAARTAVYNRSTLTVLCLLSATQITFATTNAPLVFLLTGWPETITCKLSAFVTAWWRAATSSFLLLSIWQQYAAQITVLVALCAGPKTVETLHSNTSEAGRRLARRFPISSPMQVINAAIGVAIFSLVISVYTVVLYDSTTSTDKDYRFGYFFRLENSCTFDPEMTHFARPIFLFDCLFSLLMPMTLAAICLVSMRQLPRLAETLFAYNKIHLRIVLKQLSTNCCDMAVPIFILLFFVACAIQHFAISIYRLWIWEKFPYDTFPKCQRSSDVIILLFPPVCAVLLHVWCRDIVRKENGLYDPGPSLLSMAGTRRALYCDSPPDYQPVIENNGKQAGNTVVTFSPSPGMHPSLSSSLRRHTLVQQQQEQLVDTPSPGPDDFSAANGGIINTLLDTAESTTPENPLLSSENVTPDYLQCQKTSPCLITIETSL